MVQLGKAVASYAPKLICIDLASGQADGLFTRLLMIWKTSQAIPILKAVVNSLQDWNGLWRLQLLEAVDERLEDGTSTTPT